MLACCRDLRETVQIAYGTDLHLDQEIGLEKQLIQCSIFFEEAAFLLG